MGERDCRPAPAQDNPIYLIPLGVMLQCPRGHNHLAKAQSIAMGGRLCCGTAASRAVQTTPIPRGVAATATDPVQQVIMKVRRASLLWG